MKIIWFSPHFADGGVERTILLLAKKFMEHGHETQLVSLNINSSMLNEAPDELQIVDLGTSRAVTSIRKLARHISSEKPDAVISAQHYANVVAVLARMMSRTQTRLVLTERVATLQVLRRDPPIKRFVISQLMKRTFGRADAIIANSIEGAAQLAKFLGWTEDKVGHIYNPADASAIRSMASAKNDHPWLHSPEIPFIVSAGRLSEQKDFSTLIEAFAQVANSRECRLIILGDGPERDRLEAQIQQRQLQDIVDHPWYVDNPFSYFEKAALFVLSSRYEGMPNALIEAQICGTPVVSTNCETGPTELLLDGRAGDLVPVGDADAMARAMLSALDDPAPAMIKADIGTQNLGRFDPELAYENYMKLLVSQQ